MPFLHGSSLSGGRHSDKGGQEGRQFLSAAVISESGFEPPLSPRRICIYGCLQDVLAEVFLPASEAFLVCGKVWAAGIQNEEPICHLEGMTLET